MSATRVATFCAARAGVVTTSISACGSMRARPICTSPVPGRHVDEQVVEVAPAHVGEELLERLGEDEPAPHERGALVVDEEPHRHDLEHSRRPGTASDVAGRSCRRCRRDGPRRRACAGTLKPQMSASRTPTVSPLAASAAARLTVTDDLPTPPLPLATARTRVVDGTSVGAACSRALNRARCIAADFCSCGHLAVLDLHRAHAGQAADLRLDVLRDLRPQRAAGGGERDVDHDVAVRAHPDVVDHAQVDDGGVQLGVDDARRACAGRRRPRAGHPATGSWTGAPGSSGSGVCIMLN